MKSITHSLVLLLLFAPVSGIATTAEIALAGDFCEQNNLYNDGFCDTTCPKYDEDCDKHDVEELSDIDVDTAFPPKAMKDFCEQNKLYNDGVCDTGCPNIDPDCQKNDIDTDLDIAETISEDQQEAWWEMFIFWK